MQIAKAVDGSHDEKWPMTYIGGVPNDISPQQPSLLLFQDSEPIKIWRVNQEDVIVKAETTERIDLRLSGASESVQWRHNKFAGKPWEQIIEGEEQILDVRQKPQKEIEQLLHQVYLVTFF